MLDIYGAARKARPVFKKMGWNYGGKVPTVADLADTIYRLCEVVEEERQLPDHPDNLIAGCGRFEVRCERDGDVDEYTISLNLSTHFLDLDEELFS